MNRHFPFGSGIILALYYAVANPVFAQNGASEGVYQSKGIWISTQEISRLPIAGQAGCESETLCHEAWNHIISKADGSWGLPDLTTYDLPHPPGVFAAAIAWARLRSEPGRAADAQGYHDKAVAGLLAVMGTEQPAVPNPDGSGGKIDGQLSISRQFPFYLQAGDILGLYPDSDSSSTGTIWGGYVEYVCHQKFTFRVGDGGKTFAQMHDAAASNGNAMSGAARVACDLYLGERTDLDQAWLTFRRYTGDRSVGPDITFNSFSQTWLHDVNAPVGINPPGATCHDKTYPAAGVIPNDQGRGGDCPVDPNSAPGYTQYPWEGLQGAFAQAAMFYRQNYRDPQGNDPWRTNGRALLRAAQYQWSLQEKFGGSWYDGTRAAWVKHLINVVYGFKPIAYSGASGGRNMNYTQWTHPTLPAPDTTSPAKPHGLRFR